MSKRRELKSERGAEGRVVDKGEPKRRATKDPSPSRGKSQDRTIDRRDSAEGEGALGGLSASNGLGASGLMNQLLAVGVWLIALFLMCGIIANGVASVTDWMDPGHGIGADQLVGTLGASVGNIQWKWLGLGALTLPFWLVYWGRCFWQDDMPQPNLLLSIFGLVVLTVATSALGALFFDGAQVAGGGRLLGTGANFGQGGELVVTKLGAGGAVFGWLGHQLRDLLGYPFAVVGCLFVGLLTLPMAFGFGLSEVLLLVLDGAKKFLRVGFVALPLVVARGVQLAVLGFWRGLTSVFFFLLDPFQSGRASRGAGAEDDDEEVGDDDDDNELQARPVPRPRNRKNFISEEEEEEEAEPSKIVVLRRGQAGEGSGAGKKGAKGQPAGSGKASREEVAYVPPPLDLLARGKPASDSEDDEELVQLSRQIEAKLKDFGILGRITAVHPGPVVTLFEFEPAPGVKVGRITALQDDLAMSIKASSVRIVAPLPKKGTVGIEVPNRNRDMVLLRDVLESDAFSQAESSLSVALGKDTYGEPVVVDIAAMPHLLIAGATGTGKSVCINTLLLSLLFRTSPSDLGLILIDPKVLELNIYEKIPHLRVPVVTVPKQARGVLNWACMEMDRRYRLMQRFGVRNIDGYNKVVSGEIRPGADDGEPDGDDGDESFSQKAVVPGEILEKLPKILIVIDELADLMLTVGKEIEELITRLAQKARAAGIHLILATQRPSVDVITGLIKANFPARLSFRVTSRIDSRTILDCMGAERLLGKGDMLFMQPGAVSLRRIHGAFVSDDEVGKAVKAIRSKSTPQYDEKIIAMCEQALQDESGRGDASGEGGEAEYDEFYDKAVELVIQKGQASTSMIQRTFRIGYNRAARIIEMMERDGVVGPMDGIKPREVLIQSEEGVG